MRKPADKSDNQSVLHMEIKKIAAGKNTFFRMDIHPMKRQFTPVRGRPEKKATDVASIERHDLTDAVDKENKLKAGIQ
jgi:hypothetical protein